MHPHQRFPGRGPAAKRPMSRSQAQAMLPRPAPGPNIGELSNEGEPVQDVVGGVINELWTSMLDIGTAVRLAGTIGRQVYFGTEVPSPQVFTAPSETNSEDNLRAGIANAGNAPQMENKSSARGIARDLPRPVM